MKLSMFANDMIVYMENPIDSTKKPLNLIKEFGKIGGYQVNIQKSKAFFIPTVKYQKQKLEKKIPCTIATRKIKYLGINLSKEVKDLYSENYTTLKKEIKEDTSKWKHVPCSGIGRIHISKWPYYPK